MKILIVANHYPVASARYMTDAFTRLGHEVKHVGKPMGTRIWGLELPARYEWTPTETPKLTDLIIVMDSDPAVLDFVAPLKMLGAPIAVYGVDNHVRDYRRPYFNHYFLAHRHANVMEWPDYDARNGLVTYSERVPRPYEFTHLPCAYDPTIFTPSPIPFDQRAYDVAIVGVMYPRRWELVQKLRAAGLKVFAGSGLVFENAAAAYHNARISLCVSAAGDLAQRVFETAACGCFVLTDPLKDLSDEATNKALGLQGFSVYWDDEECIERAKELLTIEKAVALAGIAQMQAAVKRHTWDARAQAIVDWFNREHGHGVGNTAELPAVNGAGDGGGVESTDDRVGRD